MPRFGLNDAIGVLGIVLAVVLLVLDKAGKLKGGWLFGLLALAAVMTLFIALGNTWVMDAPSQWRIWRGVFMIGLVVLTYSGLAIWIAEPTPLETTVGAPSPTPTLPPLDLMAIGDGNARIAVTQILRITPATNKTDHVFFNIYYQNVGHIPARGSALDLHAAVTEKPYTDDEIVKIQDDLLKLESPGVTERVFKNQDNKEMYSGDPPLFASFPSGPGELSKLLTETYQTKLTYIAIAAYFRDRSMANDVVGITEKCTYFMPTSDVQHLCGRNRSFLKRITKDR